MPPKFSALERNESARIDNQLMADNRLSQELCAKIRHYCQELQGTIFLYNADVKRECYTNLIQLTAQGIQYPLDTFKEKSILNLCFTEFITDNLEIIELAAQLIQNLSYTSLISSFTKKFIDILFENLFKNLCIEHTFTILVNLSSDGSGAFLLLEEGALHKFNEFIKQAENPQYIESTLWIASNIFTNSIKFQDKHIIDGIDFFAQFYSANIPVFLYRAIIGLANIARYDDEYKAAVLEKIDINLAISQLSVEEPYSFIILLRAVMNENIAQAISLPELTNLIENEKTLELTIHLVSDIFEANPETAQRAVSSGILAQLLALCKVTEWENASTFCIINAIKGCPSEVLPVIFQTGFINYVLEYLEYDDKQMTMQILSLLELLMSSTDELREKIIEILNEHDIIDLLSRWNDDRDLGPYSTELIKVISEELT